MNFWNSSSDDEDTGLQIAPLMDIIFLLLVFFISIALFSRLEAELNITLPNAESAEASQRTPGEIIINVASDGVITINQKDFSMGELETMLKKLSQIYRGEAVIIRGDESATHGRIMEILDICAKSDIWNVSFAALKEEKNK